MNKYREYKEGEYAIHTGSIAGFKKNQLCICSIASYPGIVVEPVDYSTTGVYINAHLINQNFKFIEKTKLFKLLFTE